MILGHNQDRSKMQVLLSYNLQDIQLSNIQLTIFLNWYIHHDGIITSAIYNVKDYWLQNYYELDG